MQPLPHCACPSDYAPSVRTTLRPTGSRAFTDEPLCMPPFPAAPARGTSEAPPWSLYDGASMQVANCSIFSLGIAMVHYLSSARVSMAVAAYPRTSYSTHSYSYFFQYLVSTKLDTSENSETSSTTVILRAQQEHILYMGGALHDIKLAMRRVRRIIFRMLSIKSALRRTRDGYVSN